MEKTCTKCGSGFETAGRVPWCKACKSASDRLYYQANREHIIERVRDYTLAHLEDYKLRQKEYRERTNAERGEYNRARAQSRREKGLGRADGRRYRQALKLEVLNAYGGVHCSCCNETQVLMLALDHLNGDGGAHRRSLGGKGNKMYEWAKKNNFPTIFRVLCHNCNWATYHNGVCPHEQERQTFGLTAA